LINQDSSLYIAIPIKDADLIIKAKESLLTFHKLYFEEVYKGVAKDSVISEYQNITGIQSVNIEELKEMAANRKAIEAATEQKLKQELKEANKKGNWKLGTGVGVGLLTGLILSIFI
jgi:hypothetical protein